jgi:hypothetical protein
MEVLDVLFVFFIVLLGFSGFLVLLGQFFSAERCTGCKRLSSAKYLSKDTKGRYWHYSCYKDGYFG